MKQKTVYWETAAVCTLENIITRVRSNKSCW